jgi:hypothetical protein
LGQGDAIPAGVRRLIAQRIESVAQLEVLLLLRAAPEKAWSAEEVGRALVTRPDAAEGFLGHLVERELVRPEEDEEGATLFQYAAGPVEVARAARRARRGRARLRPHHRDGASMSEFLLGFTTMGCLVIALFFFRFWRSSGDRFFALFCLAFLTFSVNRFVLLFLDEADEARTAVYFVLLLAFLLIIAAIVDKNRRPAFEG